MGQDQELEQCRERSEVLKVLRCPRTQLEIVRDGIGWVSWLCSVGSGREGWCGWDEVL